MPFRTEPVDPKAYLAKVWQSNRDITGQLRDMHSVFIEDLGESWNTPTGIVGTPDAFQRAWDAMLRSNPEVATFVAEKIEKSAYWSRERKRIDEARAMLRRQLGYIGPESNP